MQYGSLQNSMAGAANRPGEDTHQWQIGDGVTLLRWTDRHAATVIDVSKDGKTITIQYDSVVFAPGSMGTSVQSCDPDPNGAIEIAKFGRAGWRTVNPMTGRYGIKSGSRIIPGRSPYHDPTF